MSLIEAFKKDELIPDLIDSIPDKILKVSYDSGIELNPGSILTPTQVKNQPTVLWEAGSDFYTLLMTDLDAPSRVVS